MENFNEYSSQLTQKEINDLKALIYNRDAFKDYQQYVERLMRYDDGSIEVNNGYYNYSKGNGTDFASVSIELIFNDTDCYARHSSTVSGIEVLKPYFDLSFKRFMFQKFKEDQKYVSLLMAKLIKDREEIGKLDSQESKEILLELDKFETELFGATIDTLVKMAERSAKQTATNKGKEKSETDGNSSHKE